MIQQRFVVCLVAACLAVTLAPTFLSGQTKPCDPCQFEKVKDLIEEEKLDDCRPTVADEGLLRGYLRDGYVRLRIEFEHDDSLHKQAFQLAMARWNSQSDVTGFMFEEATLNMLSDIRVRKIDQPPAATAQGASQAEEDCATYSNQGSFIWYSPANADWLQTKADIPAAASVYAHELGHALGLTHKPADSPSLMRKGNKKMLCRTIANALPREVPTADAKNAYKCGCRLRLTAQGENPTLNKTPVARRD